MSTPEAATTTVTAAPARVTTLELFFDLVFVFTITQLTALLANDLRWRTIGQVVLMLGVIMWMYGGYAWLTNAIAPSSRSRRSLILVGMGGFLAIALAIPTAFSTAGWVFGLGYFVVNGVHTALFVMAGGAGVARAMRTLGPLNLLSSGLILAGGFVPAGGWRVAVWGLAFAVQIASPYLNPIGEFTISPSHFVERHGLLIIIALGESVVAIGAGAAGIPVTWGLLVVAVLGLSVAYLMWWVYFAGDDTEAEHALEAIPPVRRSLAALHAYGWAHLGLLLGIVAVAAGIKKTIAHVDGHLTAAQAFLLAGGVAVYLGADAVFRRILRISSIRYRAVAAVAVLATVPLGLVVGAAELAGLIVVMIAMLAFEVRGTGRADHRRYGRTP